MSTFDLYLHGTPNGHQIWGSDKNHDYISTFYNHDSNISDKAAMQIDICMGDSYYTYVHQQNVYDSGGRPGAFFAMTVSFPKSFCTNVYKLYQIFETVYNKVCVGSLIEQKQNKEIFRFPDFESSRSGNSATVDKIRAIFIKNIAELIDPFILPLGNVPDTFNKVKKQYSLVEVDSPLFFDFFKKQSIVILPNLEPASVANQAISKQLNSAILQKKSLESSNSQLQLENSQLLKENQALTNQLHTTVSTSEKKYSSTINQLKSELRVTIQERDYLKAKIDDAKSSVDLIGKQDKQLDKPFQKFARLLAGRFPKNDKKHREEDVDSAQELYQNNSKDTWYSRLNSILLGIIVVLCLIILYYVATGTNLTKSQNTDVIAGNAGNEVQTNPDDGTPTEPIDSISFDWSHYRIDILDGGDEIEKGKEYKLSVVKKDGNAAEGVPEGTWCAWFKYGINSDNLFRVPDGTSAKTKVKIEYIVNNKAELSREVTVK